MVVQKFNNFQTASGRCFITEVNRLPKKIFLMGVTLLLLCTSKYSFVLKILKNEKNLSPEASRTLNRLSYSDWYSDNGTASY